MRKGGFSFCCIPARANPLDLEWPLDVEWLYFCFALNPLFATSTGTNWECSYLTVTAWMTIVASLLASHWLPGEFWSVSHLDSSLYALVSMRLPVHKINFSPPCFQRFTVDGRASLAILACWFIRTNAGGSDRAHAIEIKFANSLASWLKKSQMILFTGCARALENMLLILNNVFRRETKKTKQC